MPQLTASASKFTNTFEIAKQNNTIITLDTTNKFVDKDIELTFNVRNAVASITANADADIYSIDGSNLGVNIAGLDAMAGTKTTTEPNTGYYIAINASGSGTPSITTTGWLSSATIATATTNNNIKYFPIKKALVGITTNSTISDPTLEQATNTITGKTKIQITPQTNNSISTDYYIALKAKEAQNTIVFEKSLEEGFLGNLNEIEISNLVLSEKNNVYYLPIPKVETMGTAVGSSTISNVTFGYNSSNDIFTVNGSSNISGTATISITREGWLDSALTGTMTGTSTVDATIDKIAGNITINGTKTYTPSLTLTNTTASGATNIGASASTTAPSTGYFVSIKSNQETGNVNTSLSITTAGYGTSAYHGIQNSGNVGITVNESSVYYIPIGSGEVTPGINNTNLLTYFTATNSNEYNLSITPKYSNTAGYIPTHSDTLGTTSYYNIKTTSISQGTTTTVLEDPTDPDNHTTIATRGTATWGDGWITNGAMPAASFSNVATNNITYVDISESAEAPILDSTDGYLYINQGYTDNLKIHIGKFISSDVTITATDQILASFTAYDSNGNLLTGTIPTKSNSDITQSGNILTIPWGKYEGTIGQHDAATYTIQTGDYSATISQDAAGAITPLINLDSNATTSYGFTTTVPIGTTGSDFLTIDPDATVTTQWQTTATANITSAGYLALGSKTQSLLGSPTIEAGTNYYVPIVTPTFSGGGLTNTDYIETPTITVSDGNSTNMDNIVLGGLDTTNYPYYFKISTSTNALSGTTTVTRAATTFSNDAGVISANTDASALASATSSPTVTINAATNDNNYVSLQGATLTFSGGALNDTDAIATFINSNNKVITTSSTDSYNNGLSIETSGTAGRDAVTYTNTAGYLPEHDNTNSQTASAAIASSTWNGETYYLTGVKLAAPSSGIAKFDITIPNGSTTDFITFQFQVDTSGNVVVMEPDPPEPEPDPDPEPEP